MQGKNGAIAVLSANVNLTVADEKVLIVNLRFMEEVDPRKKARQHGEARCSQLSSLSYVNTFV